MYTVVNPIDQLTAPAKETVFDNDRKKYIPFLSAVEKFCSENDVIIGGTMGINILVGRAPDIDDYSYLLYAESAFETSRKLADYLFAYVDTKHFDKRTIYVETNIKHEMFTVWLNSRPLITMYNLGTFRKIPIFKLIGPVEGDPIFTELYRKYYCNIADKYDEDFKILVISEELQLIQIYRELYRPYPNAKNYTKYSDLLKYEKLLFENIRPNIRERIIGSRESADKVKPDILAEKFIDTFASDVLVIGDFAIEKIAGISSEKKRLQIIFGGNIAEFTREIERVFGEITVAKYDLKIPGDKLLLKHTIYLKKANAEIQLVEIFNSTEYEVIPYSELAGVKYAGIYCLLRFKLIDLYIMKILLRLGSLKKTAIENIIDSVMSQVNGLREFAEREISANPFNIFQINNYAGVYIPENIIRKKLSGQVFFPRYFPCIKSE